MRKLILIKHARPQVVPTIPSDQWELGEEGRAACAPLAEAVRPLAPAAVISSVEPKARQTAEIVAQALGVSMRTAGNLHEQDRSNVPHMDNRDFISSMAALFSQPDRLVLGRETGDQAGARFSAAVDRILQENSGDIAIVTHGTVIALFAGQRCGREPFLLWRQMGQPSFLVLETPEWKIAAERLRL